MSAETAGRPGGKVEDERSVVPPIHTQPSNLEPSNLEPPNRDVALILLLILVAGFRLGTLLLFRSGGFIFDFSDYGWYRLAARFTNEGYYPFVDYWMEYPPPFPWLNVLLYRLSLLLLPAYDPRLWHHLLLGLTLLPFDLGILVLLYRIARQTWDDRTALWCAAAWSLLFVPLYTWAGWFDSMAVFFLLLAVWYTLAGRPFATGLTLGAGFMVKLSPILPIVVAVQRFRSSDAPVWGWLSGANVRLLGGCIGLIVALSAPWLVIAPDLFLNTFRNLFARSTWETVWALVDGYYGYGIVGGDRFAVSPTFATHAERLPTNLVLLAGMLAGLWFWSRPWNWRAPRVQVAFHTLTLATFLLVSPGWSPQFLLWVLPWVLLIFVNERPPFGLDRLQMPPAIALVIAFTALNVLELIYFVRWTDWPAVLAAIVVARTGLLALLGWQAWRMLVLEKGKGRGERGSWKGEKGNKGIREQGEQKAGETR